MIYRGIELMEKEKFLKILQYYIIAALILFSWNQLGELKKWLVVYTSLLFVIFILIYIKEKINLIIAIQNNKAIFLFIIIMIVTILTSLNRSKTFKSVIMISMATFFAICLSLIYDKRSFYSIISKYYIVSICFSIVFIFFFPQRGMMNYYGEILPIGVYSHKNVLSRYMIVGSILLFNMAIYSKVIFKKYIYIVFSVLSICLVIASKSTTGIIYISILFIVNCLFILKKLAVEKYVKLVYVWVIFFNIYIYISSSSTILSVLNNIKLFGKNLTFTGRISIWGYAINKIFCKPILGYGFDVFWESSLIRNNFYSMYGFIPPHAHNGYIGILLDGGVILLLIVIFIICSVIKKSKNIYKNMENRISILIMTFILLINIMEAAFFSNSSYLFWIIICFNYSRIVNESIELQ